MNWIAKVIRKVGGYFYSGRAEADVAAAAALAKSALPIVEAIAFATPTRSDDELVEVFRRYGVPAIDYYLQAPAGLRGQALAYVAGYELAKLAPETPRRVINAAIELAYIAAGGRKQ